MQNRVILLLTALTFSLFASDILTDYRINGIKGIEKKLDAELTKKEYWENYLKDKETKFGYLESVSNVLICNKSDSKLILYKKNKDMRYEIEKEYMAFTGKNQGDKQKEGDLKTPIGVYDLTKKLSNVDSFYGPLAFVISYPNIYDIYKGKTGSGIWIHGLPTKQTRDEFTQGCIAINNDNLECLDRNIDISKTLLIINKEKRDEDVSKESLVLLMTQIYEWRYAWLYNDIDFYLSFYALEFKRHDGMNRKDFVRHKTRIFNKQEKKTIIFNELNIVPYPNKKNIFIITFKQNYKSDSYSSLGKKSLIAALIDEKFQIITEE